MVFRSPVPTVNGTATTSDNDYVANSGTLTFAPGETTKTITIEVKGDSKKEADERFYLDLFGNGGKRTHNPEPSSDTAFRNIETSDVATGWTTSRLVCVSAPFAWHLRTLRLSS